MAARQTIAENAATAVRWLAGVEARRGTALCAPVWRRVEQAGHARRFAAGRPAACARAARATPAVSDANALRAHRASAARRAITGAARRARPGRSHAAG